MAGTSAKITLLDYQESGLEWCMKNEDKCCILAYDMGLGKTIVACELLNRKPLKTMIIVPCSIISQWETELKKYTADFKIVLYHGSNRLRARANCEDADIIITTSHVLANDIFEKVEFLRKIERWIIDEAHQLRNTKSKIYRILSSFAKNIPNKVFLTGTPICNDHTDLISLICLSNLKKYNELSFWNCMRNENKIKILDEISNDILMRKTKKETIESSLPPIKFQDITMKLDEGEQKIIYEKCMDDEIVIRRILRMRQSLNDHKDIIEKDDELICDSVKQEKIKEILSTIEKKDKVIIFSFFTSFLFKLQKSFEIKGNDKYIQMYHGKMSCKERNKSIEIFKNSPESKILLINLRSGGCGLNLVQANHVILTEPYWNESEQEQAYNRVYRIGQIKPVFVYRLSVENSIEIWLKNIQKNKKNLSNKLIDNDNLLTVKEILAEKQRNNTILQDLI